MDTPVFTGVYGQVLVEGKEGQGVLGVCGEVGKGDGVVVKEGRRICALFVWREDNECPPGKLDAEAR